MPKLRFSLWVSCQESWKYELKAFTLTKRSGLPTAIVEPHSDLGGVPTGTVQLETSPARKSARAFVLVSRVESLAQGPAVPSKTNFPVPPTGKKSFPGDLRTVAPKAQ